MPIPVGTLLGPYKILAPLGAGGMGEVYRASDTRLGREIALKILPQEMCRDGSMRARFELEARAVSALNHPNIVSIYDIGQTDDTLYIVTELVDGEPLRSVISRGPSPARKIIDIGRQIADGLAVAHSAGIVHRDLKPENVLITRDGRVKIIDFGLAKQMFQGEAGETMPPTLTMPGAVMGTIGYMSPEQIRAQTVDSRSDIFSLGVILYEMTSSKRAFPGASSADVMIAVLREDPAELRTVDLPPGLPFIIRRCLEKDPAARFQNASDLAFAMANLSAIPAVPAPEVKRPARRPTWLAWAVPALCIFGAVTYGVLHPRHGKRSRAPVAVTEPAPTTQMPPDESPELPAVASEPKAAKPVAAETRASAKAVPALAEPAPEPAVPSERPLQVLDRAQRLNLDGKYEEAVQAFSEAIKLKPQFPMAFLGRGRAFLHQRQTDRALEDFTEAIRQKPDLTAAFVDRGHLYNQQGEFEKAMPDFDQAIRLNPDLRRAYEGRAVSRGKLGDRKGAASDRKQAAKLRKQGE
jgi:tetratricopeptide (TPR) repeat protein/predicted Ser/Thr protein kinase